jgi:hypothetical protein
MILWTILEIYRKSIEYANYLENETGEYHQWLQYFHQAPPCQLEIKQRDDKT